MGGSLCLCTNQLRPTETLPALRNTNQTSLHHSAPSRHNLEFLESFLQNVLLPVCFKSTLRMFFYHLVSTIYFLNKLFFLVYYFLSGRCRKKRSSKKCDKCRCVKVRLKGKFTRSNKII